MKEINLKTKSVSVEAKSRKIRCDWSTELVKDVSSFQRLLGNEIKSSIRKQFRKKKIENLTKHTA
jgi:hypothetical protein